MDQAGKTNLNQRRPAIYTTLSNNLLFSKYDVPPESKIHNIQTLRTELIALTIEQALVNMRQRGTEAGCSD